MAVFEDCIKVTLQNAATCQPLPVLWQNGRSYVVAQPGLTWNIKVDRLDKTNPDLHLVSLSVDGEPVGGGFPMSAKNGSTICKGHCLAGSLGTGTFQAFKFAAASSAISGAVVDKPEVIQAGKVRVQVHSARYGQRKKVQFDFASAPTKVQHASLTEGKKFFMAPSLTAEKSAPVTSAHKWCEYDIIKTDEVPFIDEVIQYETASTLLLRKILDPTNPAHAQILQQCGDATTAALMQPRGSAASTAAAQLRAQSAGAKVKAHKAKVKTERGSSQNRTCAGAGPSGSREQQEAELVDLTKDVMPALTHQGRKMQRDKFAVCDLSTDNGRGPAGAWSIKKKPRITL